MVEEICRRSYHRGTFRIFDDVIALFGMASVGSDN